MPDKRLRNRPENGRAGLFYGWVVVAATFFLLFAGFGAVYSFGAFFLVFGEEFGAGRAAVSSVFSYAVFTLFMTGALSGIIADRSGPKPVIAIGVTAVVIGLCGAAKSVTLWQLILCYTFGIGAGVGFFYVPAVSAVQRWFVRRRGLASGIAVTGIGVGTLVIPIVVDIMLEHSGWRDALFVLAAVMAVFGIAGVALVEADPAARGLAADGDDSGLTPLADAPDNDALRPILTSRPFVQFYLASTILGVPVFMPFVHLIASAEDLGIGTTQAVLIFGLIGLGSTAGRFIIGAFADHLGRRRTLVGVLGGIGIAYTAWFCATGAFLLCVFALVFGICYGAYVALSPALLADYFAGPNLSSVIGMQYTAAGFGSLFGPVLAGYFFDLTGGYTVALVIGALCSAIACGLVMRMPEPAGIPGMGR